MNFMTDKVLKIFLMMVFILPFLNSCGPSQKEKMEIANEACSTIMASRKFESSKRIEVLNEARLKAGDYDYVYPLGDDFLWSSLSIGGKQACIDNIVEPPPPEPKTKAELERDREAAEKRQKEIEKERKAEEEAKLEIKRKEEEKEQFIAENSKTTYLQCKSLEGNKIALIEINKIDGEKQKLEELGIKEFDSSPAYWDIVENVETSCYSDSALLEIVGENKFCNGRYDEGGENPYNQFHPIADIYDEDIGGTAESSSYGSSILYWGFRNFLLDRVSLKASNNRSYLGRNDNFSFKLQYQCEVVSKDLHDEELNKVKDRVKKAADAQRTKLDKLKSEKVQI